MVNYLAKNNFCVIKNTKVLLQNIPPNLYLLKKIHYGSTLKVGNLEQLDLFVQNVPCCDFELNTIFTNLIRASPVLNAADSVKLKGFPALMILLGLKKQFNSARDPFMNVKFPTAFEGQPIALESLNNRDEDLAPGGWQQCILTAATAHNPR